ncbi:hypothetical protein KGQ27_01970 [Patescibacteria group bacterium]|nr:hypothetical protein [Patescibacteria group bacterium]MDE1946315.1 hypothetical protein [Patescibacteria group bacterium]MDE2010767.1 hypothetical protein [Patescibacteria group bacterium]MDE2232652.1 hypothetical protein [Patescibacteria group bacterium]
MPPINQINNANDVVKFLVSVGNVIIYLLIAAAVVFIVWNTVVYFVRGKQGDENRKEAGQHIMWGIIGLAIILSVWGLVNIVLNTFVTNNNVPTNKFPTADFINNNQNTGSSGFSGSYQNQVLPPAAGIPDQMNYGNQPPTSTLPPAANYPN